MSGTRQAERRTQTLPGTLIDNSFIGVFYQMSGSRQSYNCIRGENRPRRSLRSFEIALIKLARLAIPNYQCEPLSAIFPPSSLKSDIPNFSISPTRKRGDPNTAPANNPIRAGLPDPVCKNSSRTHGSISTLKGIFRFVRCCFRIDRKTC